jgi:AcrR family transcriptional regulator
MAESLFAQHGYHGVTLRDITHGAKVNLAAVNYHFFDKERLYVEILTRCLEKVRLARMDLLDAALSKAKPDPAPLPDIISALARPVFLPASPEDRPGIRLFGRMLTERHPFTDPLIQTNFLPTVALFGHALRRHSPSVPPQDFLWRFSFILGALHHALATLHDMKNLTQGICADDEADAALAAYTRFALAALR